MYFQGIVSCNGSKRSAFTNNNHFLSLVAGSLLNFTVALFVLLFLKLWCADFVLFIFESKEDLVSAV